MADAASRMANGAISACKARATKHSEVTNEGREGREDRELQV